MAEFVKSNGEKVSDAEDEELDEVCSWCFFLCNFFGVFTFWLQKKYSPQKGQVV